MANRWTGLGDRIRIAPQSWRTMNLGPLRPPGVGSGRWIALGPLWVRLGNRNSWRDEDLDAEMIKPVEP